MFSSSIAYFHSAVSFRFDFCDKNRKKRTYTKFKKNTHTHNIRINYTRKDILFITFWAHIFKWRRRKKNAAPNINRPMINEHDYSFKSTFTSWKIANCQFTWLTVVLFSLYLRSATTITATKKEATKYCNVIFNKNSNMSQHKYIISFTINTDKLICYTNQFNSIHFDDCFSRNNQTSKIWLFQRKATVWK